MNKNPVKKRKRIFYFDALRALAIFSVITYHAYTHTNHMATIEFVTGPTVNWIINIFLGSTFQCGVNLFLMLSGALSLGRHWEIRTFLAKRLPRITAPFLFWGFLITVILVLISITLPGFLSHYSMTPIDSYTLWGLVNYLKDSYLAVNESCTQYWFFWMILGTYLIMPIFNKWLLHSELHEAEYFLFFWLITCLFDHTLHISFPIQLTYFTGTIGLVVLGYYLRHTERKLLNNPYFGLALIIIGCLSSMIVMYLNFDIGSELTKTTGRLSIYKITEVIGIFILFKNYKKLNINFDALPKLKATFKKSAFSIAKYSYGIYLCHMLFRNILFDYFKPIFGYKIFVLILIFGTLLISWLVMALLNRIPYLNQVIGAK